MFAARTRRFFQRLAAIIEGMAVLHVTEAELVKDIAAVLAQVRRGVEVVVEQDHRAIAVIKPSRRPDDFRGAGGA